MLKISKILLSLFVITVISIGIIGVIPSQAVSQTIPGQYIVVLNDNIANPQSVANDMAKEHGFTVSHVFNTAIKGFTIQVQNDNVLNKIQRNPNVSFIEQDQVVEAFSQVIPTGIDRIDADLGVAKSGDGTGSVDVDIAIIDTGIDLDHPDLNVYRNVSFVGTSTGDDDNGHGSHVAGTAAASDNDIGVVGVAPDARLWAVKVLDSNGSGYLSGVIAGIDYVTENADQIDAANMSLGCQCKTRAGDIAINNSVDAGVTYVVAAGNSASNAKAFWPASNKNVITVSALADSDGKCGGLGSSTSYGADDSLATFSNYGNAVDIAAPGVSIYSTYKNGGYATGSGTSMSSPHVAGSAAVFISNNQGASPAEVKTALISSGVQQSAQCTVSLNDGNGGFTGDPDSSAEPLVYLTSQETVVNDSPTVSITNPADSSSDDSGATILFEGTASDTEDGDLTSSLAWTSSIDGSIGTGASFSTTLNDGDHTITAKVTDSGGKTSSKSITITVGTPPATGATSTVESITYSTTAGKNDDKHLIISIHVIDDLGNDVSGASVSIKLSDGNTIWTATGTTGSTGDVNFSLKNASSGIYTTTITGVTADGLTWDGITPDDNSFEKLSSSKRNQNSILTS